MSKDLFSTQASLYKQYRPTYPASLFEYIIRFVKERKTAWDCATGNGQAAQELSRYFDQVEATDISQNQLDHALPDNKIVYALSAAERTDFNDHRFDLITIAQAYHWFDFEAFGQEVKRVAKPGAVLAIWGYSLAETANARIDDLVYNLYDRILGSYWDAERKYVEEHYRTVPFPYNELPSTSFSMEVSWSKSTLLGYLRSWSSLQKFIAANGHDPLDEFSIALDAIWKEGEETVFVFPLFLRLGRIE